MSLLAALVRAYDRLPDAPPFGFSTEKIGFCVVLRPDGSVDQVIDLRADDKKRSPRMLRVPASPKRSGSMPRPNFMWDNINYALGAGKLTDPADVRFDAFRTKHLEFLSSSSSPLLQAFCAFLSNWKPEQIADYLPFDKPPTSGFVFAMAESYRDFYLHETPEARQFWQDSRDSWVAIPGKEAAAATCLVTGKHSAIARVHPPIKGVIGGKTEMALVSFNDNAYESYGHEQGDNAPISEAAAFAYTTVLNRYLEKDSGHRVQIGDASTVFWADASDMKAGEEAESFFAAYVDPGAEERLATSEIRARLDAIRQGQHLSHIAPELAQGVRFHVLGLAPNAARLSVRFYWQDDFGRLTANYQQFLRDTEIQPPPRDGWPPLWRYLIELASQGKRENVPPLIAGEWLRAILAGAPYPLTLLSTVLMRLRADGQINALRIAILKSVLIRNFKSEVPVALDPANTDRGYVLGRLFALYEEVQRAALGGINASIRDKFYGAASATPQKVFRTLDSGSANHFSKLRKTSPGRAVNLDKLLTSITDLMEPGADPIPVALGTAEQAMFGIGYYHQRADFFRKQDMTTNSEDAA
ncbi:type I-C CRISPR-associated protein Cas8c/Csd1 [uncultured Paracoccus sp.]|mgnify:CR=1 FL=1|uniref:type I-C CRISPR-associated protein Cas8c/Csd1 n=1 Tax=uncultured Paracoccus sp. TaxID=189685 RepID=UPI002612EACC|nr:type I-C CRISPR-associated protein Cas8c/Csd1 [uncultured Paracoccus sp.]HMR36666.1 type I-C CRISPR-associated protein Cas8c/Csd1 [Paracoccus sp. (in: a-proteobacteria)]